MNSMTITTTKKEIHAKNTPTTPAPPAGEADDSAHRDYDLPIPSQKLVSDDYERDNDKNDKDDKVEGW